MLLSITNQTPCDWWHEKITSVFEKFTTSAPLKAVGLGVMLVSNVVLAQNARDSVNNPFAPLALGLEEVMNLQVKDRFDNEVSIASKKSLNVREAPGIVSVITRDEILRVGARDLIDVLSLIPGIYFGVDVKGVVGIGIRGNWAHEGKVLLQINGISLNETLYATTFYGNRFPVEAIQRIELIRGPGSAIYGGYAELGVINIITQSAEEINGVRTSLTYSQTMKGLDRMNGFASFGKKKDELAFSLFAYHGQGSRSHEVFEDFYGNRFRMNQHSSLLSPTMLHGILNYKNLEVKYFYEHYHTTNQTAFVENLPTPIDVNFQIQALQVNYKMALSKKLSLMPKMELSYFTPYYNSSEYAYRLVQMRPEVYTGVYGNPLGRRGLANLLFAYEPSDNVSLLVGLESFEDKGDGRASLDFSFQNGNKEVFYYNNSVFVQGLFRTRWFTLTTGGRVDQHSKFGSAFAPRFALTRAWERFHLKLLLSNAFRQPSIQNITLNTEIKPEKTNVIELETGYQWNEKFNTKINFFDNKVKDPIIYLVDEQGESYKNYGEVAVRGVELEGAWKDAKWGYCKLNYSFYTTYQNTVSVYAIPKKGVALEKEFEKGELITSSELLGMPQHKAVLYASMNLTKNFSLNPSYSFIGTRYGFVGIDAEAVPFVNQFSPHHLFDLQLMRRDFLTRGLTMTIGAHNLLDQQVVFIQPYNGGHAPLPGLGRSFMLRMMYNVPF